MAFSRTYTPEQALQKARHYCAYQERCHQEVKEKLYGYGLRKQETEQLIARLIEEDYLNEERYALAFAGGKSRIKNWGRGRISMELKQRQVSEYCIRKALASIPEEDYLTRLDKLAESKWESLAGEEDRMARLRKFQDYLLRKGYEWELVQKQINKYRKP
ncbi:RecX family transcriptional regulator [Flavihumibacter rivuli]|uniref:regulatory protein RecX n=1 Tax=Flavihumibacter rivuli TaxID=2838156 RepID=UPI001BDE59A5|nr:regulatory protein RecX [Flavihumibacter rivuli]ULQ55622.1 RecX family transcriptional regulator [Flavihumibacter rivuli]